MQLQTKVSQTYKKSHVPVAQTHAGDACLKVLRNLRITQSCNKLHS